MRCGGFTVADNQIISYLITRYNQLDNGMATFQTKISYHFYQGVQNDFILCFVGYNVVYMWISYWLNYEAILMYVLYACV